MSDSEESTTSTGCLDHIPSLTTVHTELSIVAEFDDLIRSYKQCPNEYVENIFYSFVEQSKEMLVQWRVAVEETRRLQIELDKKIHELSDTESKLVIARKLLDQEKRNTRHVEEERDVLEEQISKVRDVLVREFSNKMPDSTREKLQFLNIQHFHDVNPNNIGNTTGSLLSDFSYSLSEDDLDVTSLKREKLWKKHRPSMEHAREPALKKRKSSGNKIVEISNSETVRATTTLTISKLGPITATSVIESVPSHGENNNNAPTVGPTKRTTPSTNLIYDLWQASPQQIDLVANLRQHSLNAKTVVMPDTCGPCEKRIRFGKTALKCRNCRAMCHPECKDNLPLPCIPSVNTPTQRNMTGVIGDYAPTTPPMVPAIIVHCLKEIEAKGLNELGIYRIPGAEKDVKSLKEKFLKGRGAPSLTNVDVHVICGTVKDFLRSLNEPLVTFALWPEFTKAIQAEDLQDIAPALCQIVSELPQTNRDTLAYMILHLKKVGEAKECKMPISNLSKVFGPTIIGYSSADPHPSNLISETRQQVCIMEHLINLPIDYWAAYVNVYQNFNKLQQTPSTDSLLRPTATRGFLTPSSVRMRYGHSKAVTGNETDVEEIEDTFMCIICSFVIIVVVLFTIYWLVNHICGHCFDLLTYYFKNIVFTYLLVLLSYLYLPI